MTDSIAAIAETLFDARLAARAVPPPSETAGLMSVADAYAIQHRNSERRRALGDCPVGRKIGLTSLAAQRQFGVDQPDLGLLWQSTRFVSGAVIPFDTLLFPRVEAELALILARDIDDPALPPEALRAAVAAVVPALEIVDSRVADWRVTLADTVADNASGWGFVLGGPQRPLGACDLSLMPMRMTRGGALVSEGSGAAVMGDPLTALAWAAQQAVALGQPLRAGDVVMTGALGPVVPAERGDHFVATIGDFPPVEVRFS
jgi:2-keto-4-pentenoate hydratase